MDLNNLSSDPESSGDDEIKPQSVTYARRPRRSMPVKKNMKGETQLHLACIQGNLQSVKLYVEQGHPINVKDNGNWLPIHEAANHGHLEILEYLLDNGAQSGINSKAMEGMTPLIDACYNGHIAIANLLLDRGAKAYLKTDHGDSALDALESYFEAKKQLLDDGDLQVYRQLHKRISEQCERVGVDARSTGQSSGKSTLSALSSGLIDEDAVVQESPKPRYSRTRSNSSSSEDNEQSGTGVKQYKSAIEQLRNRGKTGGQKSPEPKKKKQAFLDPTEVDTDCWLDDDLGPSRKKQKFFSDAVLDPTPIKESSRFNVAANQRGFQKKISGVFEDDDEIQDVDGTSQSSNSSNAFDRLMNNENSR